MERKIVDYLIKWNSDINKKPLFIFGNKQIGKTYTVLGFGQKYYKNIVYINTFNNEEILNIFKKENTLNDVIKKISLYSRETIFEKDTLIVLDNLADLEIFNAVKKLFSENNLYHLIMISSLKDNLLKFKGSEITFKQMTEMDFEEFLRAIDNVQLVDFIRDSFKTNKPMPFHSLAFEYFYIFLATGGLPRAVKHFVDNKKLLLSLRAIHNEHLDMYKKELLNLDNPIDIVRGLEIINNIHSQLLKPNRKFQYRLIKKGGRTADYEKPLTFLHNNGFIYKCYRISEVQKILSTSKEEDNFKAYLNDTGILYHLYDLNDKRFLTDDKFKNILFENSVLINLVNNGFIPYYYQSEGKAEVSFVIQTRRGDIYPIEVVNKLNPKSKSLNQFRTSFNITNGIKVVEENFKIDKGVKYIPVYATFCFDEL